MHFDDFMALRKVEYSVHHPDKLNVEFELVDLSHNLIKITPRYLCSTENDVVKVNCKYVLNFTLTTLLMFLNRKWKQRNKSKIIQFDQVGDCAIKFTA